MAGATFTRLPAPVENDDQLVWRIGEPGRGPGQFGEWSANRVYTVGTSSVLDLRIRMAFFYFREAQPFCASAWI